MEGIEWSKKAVKGGDVAQLTSRFSELLEQRGVLLHFKRGDLIYGLNDPNDMIYWIKKGRVKLSYLDETGRKLTLDIFGQSQLFGELSLTPLDKRELLAEALETTEVVAADRNRLLDQAKRDPRLMLEILTLIGKRSRNVQHKLEDMAFKDLPTRLARILLHLADKHGHPTSQGTQIDCRLTHQDLADLIGATRTNVTMMLSAFYSKGLLKKGRYITITNEKQLREKGYGHREKQLN